MNEEWRPVPGYPDYRISSRGALVSLRRKVPKLMNPGVGKRGYRIVRLVNPRGSVDRTRTVHQLVAEAFHGPRPSPDHEVRHLNGVKTDNRAENVRWDTRSENQLDNVRHGTHYAARKTHCPQGHPYDEVNTYVLPSRPTARYCRPCHIEASRRARRAAGAVPRHLWTHCKRGHEFNEANTYRTADGRHRQCRACKRLWDTDRELYARTA